MLERKRRHIGLDDFSHHAPATQFALREEILWLCRPWLP